MKNIRLAGILFSLGVIVGNGKAQVLTFDLQSFLQTAALKALGEDQLTTLGNMLQVNTDTLEASNRINTVLGSADKSQLDKLNLNDVGALLRAIPGLESVDVAKLFPPGVAGAFVGKSFAEWRSMIADPTAVIADQLRRHSMGDLIPRASSDDKAFVQTLVSAGLKRGGSGDVSTSLSRMMTSRMLDAVGKHGEQTAAYSATKNKFDLDAQKNLTLIDRAKLTNNQNILSLELQLQQLESQSMAHSVQAMQADTQTRLMEQQIQREETDRLASPP